MREGSGRRSAGSHPNLGERAENLARNAELVVVLHEAPKVTIAAVNGAADIAAQIAERNPIAIQGTIRAIWEATELSPAIAKQNGMAYTHIGNAPAVERQGAPRINRQPTLR